ncbi:hypothetical protein PGUG_05045 [Meyerozyma guilliermondii ATCC 6260]|uniref:Uncharacterized protein n=1 Tax=Meyerozyma guilliermondii (strain ATCC 6260 / CBS 566 / DSM 6381 / JCM 1539 / NBRC 10279 / NRRL Y-324) TaxID=294746 RepID=A5DP44_PICGU|nr:uncharacterized protein PGUG_05045 [Meyerozyma guilliermondii ATCC 6260]EDK40948.2 hypothetical protein PGUG_05045 [Meyerozyma guilliermondii ATCC 6260]
MVIHSRRRRGHRYRRQIVARRRGPWAQWMSTSTSRRQFNHFTLKCQSVISQLKVVCSQFLDSSFQLVDLSSSGLQILDILLLPSTERLSCRPVSRSPFRVRYRTVAAVHSGLLNVSVVRGPNSSSDGISSSLFVDILSAPNMMMIWVLGTVTWTGASMSGISNSCCSNCIYSSKIGILVSSKRRIYLLFSWFCCGFLFGPAFKVGVHGGDGCKSCCALCKR